MENEEVIATEETADHSIRETWNWSLDTIREKTTHYPPESQEALVGLFMWCTDPRHPMKKDEAARRLNCSENLLYQIFTGVYRNPDKSLRVPSADLIKSIREFIALEQRRYEAGQTEFVITPTAKKIFTACDLARESRTPVILFGPSHIGKTWALSQYQSRNNHGRTFMAELEAASGLGGMVRTIAAGCRYSGKSSTPKLIERVKHALTPNSLLIVDEMHLLKHTYRLGSFFACVEVLRRIFDYCKCGMVLSWTNLDNLRNASQDELVQLWRRGVHRIALPPMPTKGDLAAILEHNGLAFPDKELRITVPVKKGEPIVEMPYEILRALAKNDGLLAITERLRYATKLSSKADKKITWDSFVKAHLTIEKQAVPEPEWD